MSNTENTEQPKPAVRCTDGLAAVFEYRGKMYMRPCDRGAVLEDIDKQFDNDVLPDGDYVCEIRVWKAANA